jgi:nucleotide-binding universal stress UspA family protein
MKIMVAYDGTLQAKEALAYGIEKAREKGGEVIALHVFNSSLFIDYDAHVDAEAIARRDSARFVDEARTLIREKGNGVRASLFSTEGNPAEEVVSFAKEKKVDVLLCPPKFRAIINKYEKNLAGHELMPEAAKMNLTAFSTKTM